MPLTIFYPDDSIPLNKITDYVTDNLIGSLFKFYALPVDQGTRPHTADWNTILPLAGFLHSGQFSACSLVVGNAKRRKRFGGELRKGSTA